MSRHPKKFGLLTALQKEFLSVFSGLSDQAQFYLTGGTALAEYYLGHRLSIDLDFFTGVDNLILPTSYQIENACRKKGHRSQGCAPLFFVCRVPDRAG